ncbi:hypothetical protein [Tabrizicola caldifontis]|uniref:hypothetical protein n=1 Tax=Tabrizicola caldifontis TaxID=2528036 RepID=UPI001F106B0B|nr:hypothetical protein [Rhodobacter sp. YIM 73028]
MPLSRRLFALSMVAALAGCGGFRDSRLNPRNWFGRSKPRETIVLPTENRETRPLVDVVLSMSVEPIPGGAIVRARGQTPTQGWWQAELVPMPIDDNEVLVYEFRLQPPVTKTDVNTPQSRQVDVAIYISDIRLERVREIVVQGATNARSARR